MFKKSDPPKKQHCFENQMLQKCVGTIGDWIQEGLKRGGPTSPYLYIMFVSCHFLNCPFFIFNDPFKGLFITLVAMLTDHVGILIID